MNDIIFRFRTRKLNGVIITEVTIHFSTPNDHEYFGYGVKSPNDQHWKAKGQRAAVLYAIKDVDDKVEVAEIMEKFFEHSTATKKLKGLTNGR